MADTEQATKPENNVKIEDAGPCKKKVIVEVPEKSIQSAFDEQYNSLRKDALVPGFRKGRAPRQLLEKRFGKQTSEQVKLKLLADASDSAIKDNKLDVLNEPDIDYEKIELPESGPLKFEFEVEVKPEFDLPQLEGITVIKKKLEVTDEQIEREIEQLRKYSGVWAPRKQDGKVEKEDQIIADIMIKTQPAGDDKTEEQLEEEQTLNNVEIFVRKNGFVSAIPVENLDELLEGAKSSDVKETTVDVPKTYFREEYRGKKVVVKIEIKEIKYLKPAQLDQAFLQRFQVEDENELREKIRDSLQARLEAQTREDMTEQIYNYMLKNIDFEMPTDVVADQSTQLLRRQYAHLLSQGLPKEQLDEQMDQLRAASDQQAKKQLKTYFIMEKVADKLDIEVTEEEVNGHIARLAMQRGQRPEKMREEMIRSGSLAQFRAQVREEKCIAKLLESAKITEEEQKKTKIKKTEKKTPAKTTAKKTTKKTKTTKKKTDKKD